MIMNHVEILALCPRILSVKSSDISSYLENYLKTEYNEAYYGESIFGEKKDYLTAENNKIKIKIFKSGIAQLKNVHPAPKIIDQVLYLSKMAENISLNLFHSEVLFDISIKYSWVDCHYRNKRIMEILDFKSISGIINDTISYELRKDESICQIKIKGIETINDIPKIIKSIEMS